MRRAYDEAFFTKKRSAPRTQAALESVHEALDRLERARAAEPKGLYVVGASPTLADAAILPSFWLLKDLADDFPRALPSKRWPSWRGWYERMIARSDVAAVLAEAEA